MNQAFGTNTEQYLSAQVAKVLQEKMNLKKIGENISHHFWINKYLIDSKPQQELGKEW